MLHLCAISRATWHPPAVLQEVVELVVACLATDPARRPTAAQVLQRLQGLPPGAGSSP